MSNHVVENTYQVSSPARLKLQNIRGSVLISPGSDGEVFVSAVKHPEGKDEQDTQISMEQASDGQVIVKTHFTHERFNFSHRQPCRVDYTLRLPRQTVLDVSGVSSSLSVQGLEGKFQLESVSGEMHLENLTGSMKLSTVSGDVRGAGISGSLVLNTVSGDIRLERSDISSLRGETVSGEINIDTPLGEGPYQVNAVSGDMILSLPEGTCCTVETHSVSGRAKLDLPVTSQQRNNGHSRADVNGGGTPVHYGSVSGCLVLHSGVRNEAGTKQKRSVNASKGEILEKIDRGEITVEEGIALLNKA